MNLIQAELYDELQAAGFIVSLGQMDENVTTRGIDLLRLPTSTRLHLSDTAIIELTGFQNLCTQLNQFQPGLMVAVLGRDEQGNLIRKAAVIGIVISGSEVRPDDLTPNRTPSRAAPTARAGLT